MNDLMLVLPGTDTARPERPVIASKGEARAAFLAHRGGVWLAPRSTSLDLLSDVGAESTRGHRLLTFAAPSPSRLEVLRARFEIVLSASPDMLLLSLEEAKEVFEAPHPQDLFLAGLVDHEDEQILLFRGNLSPLVVPFAWFQGGAAAPDFHDFEIVDGGQTLRFGRFEAAADALLYEFDREARKRMKAREREQDATFGGSLRRLRLLKGLARSDFAPLDEKTIARLERNEGHAPRAETLATIAARLGVDPDELGTF